MLLLLLQTAFVPGTDAQPSSGPRPVETRLLAFAFLEDLPSDSGSLRVVEVTLPAGQSTFLSTGKGAILIVVERGELFLLEAGSPPLAVTPGQQWSDAGPQTIEIRNDGILAAAMLVVSLAEASSP